MPRSLLFLVLMAAGAGVSLGACTNDDTFKVAAGSVGAGPSSSSGGPATGSGGAGGEGMCNLPPPPSATLPPDPGCYENLMNTGWVAVPCGCELWLPNTTHEPLAASITLTVTPSTAVPMLTPPLEIGIGFEDPDASWYATWAAQAGNGSAFTVTAADGGTAVNLEEDHLVLDTVAVPPCTTRKAVASIYGTYPEIVGPMLQMQAVLGDGGMGMTIGGGCVNPPPEL